jgi:hypothetical protein
LHQIKLPLEPIVQLINKEFWAEFIKPTFILHMCLVCLHSALLLSLITSVRCCTWLIWRDISWIRRCRCTFYHPVLCQQGSYAYGKGTARSYPCGIWFSLDGISGTINFILIVCWKTSEFSRSWPFPSSTKKVWNYTSTTSYAFMVW